jgi:hypothetical protein
MLQVKDNVPSEALDKSSGIGYEQGLVDTWVSTKALFRMFRAIPSALGIQAPNLDDSSVLDSEFLPHFAPY